ncbi:hypothetical protein E8E11_001258 [Didymella keratinophila]|nr:hypothetical protein E8E11_001258 [Didymella keratinophila]
MDSQQHVRVAVVGSGMAGLVTAHLLKQDGRERYAVKVFESGNTLSLDSASVSVPNAARASPDRVDLPMRAFAGGFYSNLRSMYDYLGIRYQSQPFLFEFAQSRSPYFTHASNLHRLPARPNGVGLIPYLLELGFLALCYVYFSLCCFFVAPHTGETLQAYFERTWMPEHFVTYFVLPLISSGVRAAQDRLAKGIQYELNTAIVAVEPQEKGVRLSWNNADGKQQNDIFDKVVLAVAPDVVGQVFEPLEHHMACIPTAVVESVVHTDDTVLNIGYEEEPPGRRGGNAQLIHLNTSKSNKHKTESHHIQPCGAIVTTCPFSPLEESRVTHSARFTRVLRSPQSQRIVNAIFGDTQECYSNEKAVPLWRNGDDNVYLVGGWCWDGMVLLEGCVVSAMRVAEALDVKIPWR